VYRVREYFMMRPMTRLSKRLRWKKPGGARVEVQKAV
jgi:hypothetical protein